MYRFFQGGYFSIQWSIHYRCNNQAKSAVSRRTKWSDTSATPTNSAPVNVSLIVNGYVNRRAS
jgi:hypothetical protein